jgi:glycosyltransferase involved in cell wall biosynthesis
MFIVAIDKTDNDTSGATYTFRALLKKLTARGHTVKVIVMDKPTAKDYFGYPCTWYHYADLIVKSADAFLVQHYPCGPFVRKLNPLGRPVAYIANFSGEYAFWQTKMPYEEIILCMSDIMKDKLSAILEGKSYKFITVNPPVHVASYKVAKTADTPPTVGFINCNQLKGALLFYKVAEAMPHVQFLTVKGYYHYAIQKQLPNVKYLDYTHNIQEDVYKNIKLLLCPSLVESWSRVANEAMCSGIPVLYTKPFLIFNTKKTFLSTEGMAECIGDGGIGLEKDDVKAWTEAIDNLLQDEAAYTELSAKAEARAVAIEEKHTDDAFVSMLEECALRNRRIVAPTNNARGAVRPGHTPVIQSRPLVHPPTPPAPVAAAVRAPQPAAPRGPQKLVVARGLVLRR